MCFCFWLLSLPCPGYWKLSYLLFMQRLFSRFYFKASQLQVFKTTSPKNRIPDDQLIFGKSFTDHMLTVEWASSSGWSNPVIKPLQNLSLSPAASVFHYATEVSLLQKNLLFIF